MEHEISQCEEEREKVYSISIEIVQCRGNYETCTVDILSHAMASAPNVTYLRKLTTRENIS